MNGGPKHRSQIYFKIQFQNRRHVLILITSTMELTRKPSSSIATPAPSSNSNAHYSTAASYDVQLRIRREAEERRMAHQDLNSWMNQIKSNKERGKSHTNSVKLTSSSTNKNKSTDAPKTGEPKLPSNSMASITANEPSNSHKNCEEERLRGNRYFAQGQYEDAIQCYTRCLGSKDALESPIVYSNRGTLFDRLVATFMDILISSSVVGSDVKNILRKSYISEVQS